MITWFDALLVTLWAAVTALGARRGLGGLAWGLGGVAACFLANSLSGNAPVALIIGAAIAVGVGTAVTHRIQNPLDQPWHLGAGALGGFALGGVLIATLALSFPLDVQVDARGSRGVYPSVSLPPALYTAVRGSALQNGLRGVWSGNAAVKTLLIPDQTRR
ncbi:hypothetical protein [Deinococcus soli (ex Cha et al. 2016)]|uniref:Colicin V production protein n=1 Tax=Deinococcus soli (ex Cha et al. 2016) TaxID=1309411 RepID=A0A0F7JS48_9DEIO|nr:hypothetical protein [Deinococcus soli (ex Cha et al. 2016)]AKH17465.1 hypothetical protein SY84_10915 [Deinococcus soli (ex Cha et al. 2016)]